MVQQDAAGITECGQQRATTLGFAADQQAEIIEDLPALTMASTSKMVMSPLYRDTLSLSPPAPPPPVSSTSSLSLAEANRWKKLELVQIMFAFKRNNFFSKTFQNKDFALKDEAIIKPRHFNQYCK